MKRVSALNPTVICPALLLITLLSPVPAVSDVSSSVVACLNEDREEVPCDDTGPNEDATPPPPIIVWHHASAGGSTMSGLTVTAPPSTALITFADTPITLRQKGEFAMAHGDYNSARQYFSAAGQRGPGDPELSAEEAKLEQLNRAGDLASQNNQTLGIPKFVKTDYLMPTHMKRLEPYRGNPEVMKLHDAEQAAFKELSKASAALQKSNANLANGSGSQADAAQAQANFEADVKAFQEAQANLKQEIARVEPKRNATPKPKEKPKEAIKPKPEEKTQYKVKVIP